VSTTSAREQTREHIARVSYYIHEFVRALLDRADVHDASKLGPEEAPTFERMTPILKTLEYGTDEYRAALAELGPALQHHYQNNRHHPEHYPNGVAGMTLVDLVEMWADWQAAVERHETGDIMQSIAHNTERFSISAQLAEILQNTAKDAAKGNAPVDW